MRQVRKSGGTTVNRSKCPLRIKTGAHVYAYRGDKYECACGRTVKYDIATRDFVAEDK